MAANYVLIREVTLNASAASVTLDNIPQSGYTDLKLVMSARMSNAVNVVDDVVIAFNGSTSSFSMKRFFGAGAGNGATDAGSPNYNWIAQVPNSAATANTFSNSEIYIPNYTSSSNKSFSADSVSENNAAGAYAYMSANVWANTDAISSITLSGYSSNFLANSSFSIYGIAKLGVTPTVVPKASGGDIVVNDGTYWYHAFLASGTFKPNTTLSCDALVIAGGGAGGGTNNAGGGGAGGYRLLSSQSLPINNYAITVGAGGSPTLTTRENGTNSSIVASGFTTISSSGGGGGGTKGGTNEGANGGSGGGAAFNTVGAGTGNTGGYSPVEGYAGADGIASPTFAAGGGGGASGAASTGGAGANGSNSASSWATATSTGVSGYYAGGGGGGTNSTSAAASSGGGGRGAASTSGGNTDPTSGTINTGSGGGGGVSSRNSGYGAAGGSGIVIIKYAMA